MFNYIILWGSDRACDIIGLTGLTTVIGQHGAIECPYQGSFSAGIIFWALVLIALLLIPRIVTRRR